MRGDGLYARLECEFIRSFRFQSLPVGARMLYLSLWCYALEQRREIIDRPSDKYLATLAGLSRHPIATYTRLLHDSNMIFLEANTIEVIGLAKKHNKINFKNPRMISYGAHKKSKAPIQDNNKGENTLPPPFRGRVPQEKGGKNPDIKKFIDWYFILYSEKRGSKLVVSGKDAAQVKRLLQTLTLDELKSKAEMFIADADKFAEDKSIARLAFMINKYNEKREANHAQYD